MKINKKELAQILGVVNAQTKEEMLISIFVVSKKSPRLKLLALDSQLSPEKRAEKLRNWA